MRKICYEEKSLEDSATGEAPWLKHYESEVPHTIQVPEITLHQFFERIASEHPAAVATIFFGERLTYAQLDEQANRFAAGLQSLGVSAGDNVALVLPNCPQFIVAFFGVLKAGAVAVPLNPAHSPRDLSAHFTNLGIKTVIALNTSAARVQEAMPEPPVERLIITLMQDTLSPLMSLMQSVKERRDATGPLLSSESIHRYLDLIRNSPLEYVRSEAAPDNVAVLLHTSGITAAPRCVVLTHRNLVANALQLNAWLWDTRPQKHDIYLGAVPFFQGYGLTGVLNLAVSSASSIVLLPRPAMKEILRAIAHWRPTIFPGVPTIYDAITRYPASSTYDLRSVRICISGETPLAANLQQAFESLTGARLLEGYGLAEATHMTHCNPIYGERRTGSIGLPLPMTEAGIIDPDSGVPLPVGEVGELVVRGPQVMKGYWPNSDDTVVNPYDGWLHTSDLARQDSDGYFYVVGRKAEIIWLESGPVNPYEVEAVLYQNNKVRDVVVVRAHNKRHDVIVAAYVVLQPDVEATESELRKYTAERLADYMVPARIEFRESLPRSATGKLLRRELEG